MTNTAGTDWVKNLYGGKGWNDKADLFLFLQCLQRALAKHGGFELRVNTDLSCEMVVGKHRGSSLSADEIEEERRLLCIADSEADMEYRSLLAERLRSDASPQKTLMNKKQTSLTKKDASGSLSVSRWLALFLFYFFAKKTSWKSPASPMFEA